jgi:transcriptional regulator GlxA family with amidase domain
MLVSSGGRGRVDSLLDLIATRREDWMASKTAEQTILERLDQIVRILALQVAGDRSVTDGVWLLKLAGLDNKTIAEVMNTSESGVRALLSNQRRQRAKSIRAR